MQYCTYWIDSKGNKHVRRKSEENGMVEVEGLLTSCRLL